MDNHQPELSRLCHLIDRSLRPFSELVLVNQFTKQVEKDLLISLSRLLGQIKEWTNAIDSDSDSEDTVEEREEDSKLLGVSITQSDDNHRCLTKIIGDLMVWLGAANPYIQHVAGNVLVAISEFLIAYECCLDEFMQLICLYLDSATQNSLSSSSEPVAMGVKDLNSDSSTHMLNLKMNMENENWLTMAAAIIQVLRDVVKLLKHNPNYQAWKVCLDSVSSFLLNMPWDLLKVYPELNDEAVSGNSSLQMKASGSKAKSIFQGNLVQLLCSLVQKSGSMNTQTSYNHPVTYEISNILSNILSFCLCEPEGRYGLNNQTERPYGVSMTQYLRHKILTLIIKLSFSIPLDYSTLLSWMDLVHVYFQNLLVQPIDQLESDEGDCLQGTPFRRSAFGAKRKSISSRHLQRLAVFLFLRCSFSLIRIEGKTDHCCASVNPDAQLRIDQNGNLECCTSKKGFSAIDKWLQAHLPVDTFADHEIYSQRCLKFGLSFLQLFMHEDDLLFEMLLLLFYLESDSELWVVKRGSLLKVKNEVSSLLCDVFNPIHLFHLFLQEILYDHQVLLDYLISKDTGAKSAEYILRCLRTICDSWNTFVEFPENGSTRDQLSQKRRKLLADNLNFGGDLLSTSAEIGGISPSTGPECHNDHSSGSKHRLAERLPFENARRCLFSLKTSIENLHQKSLFPYNPQALLRRLTQFQELCKLTF